jgi:DNA-binding response OmpR family regulator
MVIPPHIALIDDERSWLEILAEYLSLRGFQVRTALGGPSGLSLLTQGEVGLAVVDFHMPELNGLDLLRRLRQGRHNVDVLLMSSDDDPGLPGQALAAGAAAFLSKSMAPALLLPTLIHTLTATLEEMAQRPPYFSRWDRFLPILRSIGPQLPILAKSVEKPSGNPKIESTPGRIA